MRELKAQPRNELGKQVKTLRRGGFLPAVVYGEGVASQPISVPYKAFEKVWHEAGESSLIVLDVDGKTYNVLIHDIMHDPLRGTPLHADFYAVRMDKPIRAKISVEFLGESPAVKNLGGILIKVRHELEVEALPKDLPHTVQANLASLTEFESKLHVGDILLPQGVTMMAGTDDIIALVEPPRSEQEIDQLKEVVTAEVTEVKTEREIKQETEKVAEVTTGEEK